MPSQPVLELQYASQALAIPVRYLLNVGYAGRNRAAVEHHLDELAGIGIPRPTRVPTVYPVSSNLALTCPSIQVQHDNTSGEVEYVVIVAGERRFVTVGSDHTDRTIEQTSVPWAKQACPNIVAPEVWLYEEVKPHWDDLLIRSWVAQGGDWLLYQETSLSELIRAEELLALAKEVVADCATGLVLFSGTVPTRRGLICGEGYRIEIEDPHLGRSISHEYAVEVLPPAIQ